MHGTGPPLVTPFDSDGDLDVERLVGLVGWLEDRGVDFLVPAGSTSEAPLMSADERTRCIETVVDAADVPVLAGTGHPGYRETLRATTDAAAAGADAALVVTPYYYDHDAEIIEAYYRDLADAVDIPLYLYNVPQFTGVTIAPDSVGRLADHPNIAGVKDSSGDVEALHRTRSLVDDDVAVLTGSGGVYPHALAAGADGGILAVANVAPERATAVHDRDRDGDRAGALEAGRGLVALNHAVTARYGVAGLKHAMRARGAPAGYPRRPHARLDRDATAELDGLVEEAVP